MKTNLFLIVFAFACLTSPVNAQWQKTGGPAAAAGNVTSVASIGDNLFAATSYGGMFLSKDEGHNWTAVNNGMGPLQVMCLAVSGTRIFAGTGGGLFVSADTGANWTHINNGIPNAPLQSLTVKGAKMFAGDAGGSMYFSSDTGASWTLVNTNLTSAAKLSLATDGTNTYAGSYGAGIYVTTNDGASWTQKNIGLAGSGLYVFALAMNGTDIFAGTGGGVFKSVNNGASWTPFGAASINILSLMINESYIFAGTYGSGIFYSPVNSLNWIGIPDGLTSYSVPSLVANGENIYAGTADSGVYKRPFSNILSAVKDIRDESRFDIFPNPAGGNFTLWYHSSNSDRIKITITGLLGETVYTTQEETYGAGFYKEINLQDASRGIYIVSVSTEKEIEVKMIMKE